MANEITLVGEDCCNEQGNHKVDLYYSRKQGRSKSFNFAQLRNPLDDEIKDKGDLKSFFETFGKIFVPYRGSTTESGHATLNFFLNLPILSPSLGGILTSIRDYTFGKLRIVRKEDAVFDFGEEAENVNPQLQRDYVEFLRNTIVFMGADESQINLRKFVNAAYDDMESCGNRYIEVVVTKTLDVPQVTVHVHDPRCVMYMFAEKGDQRFFAISPKWSAQYIRDNPPDVIPRYPAFSEEDGVARTMIHEMNGNYRWYGLPRYVPGFLPAFNQHQNYLYLTVQAANNFTGQLIIETEGDDPNVMATSQNEEDIRLGYDNTAHRIEENFTMKGGDPMTVLYMERPYGSKPFNAEQIKPNTNQDFYIGINKMTREDLVQVLGWSLRLLGDSSASGLSTNLFTDEMATKAVSTIESLQERETALLVKIINIAIEVTGKTEFADLSPEFISPLKELLDQRQEAENPSGQNS